MEEDRYVRILGNRVQELLVEPPHGRFLQRGHQGQNKDMFSKKEKQDVVEDGEKKKLVEATSELFFAETFKLQFFPEIYYIIGLQCWSIALFDGSPTCTTLQIFHVRKTVEDPRKSTNLPKR